MSGLSAHRVLVLHNRYRIPGGEERFVAQLVDLLDRQASHTQLLERSSRDAGAVRAAAGLLRGGLDPEEIADIVREQEIDVVHAHNIHPLLGHRALAAARAAGAATVLHLHNYRLFCAIGTAWRDGADCTQCAPRRTSRGLRHNCRGSLPESAVYASALGRGQQATFDSVDRFAAPVVQLADDFDALGFELPISVLPSWMAATEFAAASQAGRGEYALLVSRLSSEKGVLTAIAASAQSGVPLRIAGDGPDAMRARRLAEELAAPVDFMGRIDGQALVAARMGAGFALVPSIWREVLPLSALESLAAGLPLVVSDRGGLPELTEPDLVTPAGDVPALAKLMSELHSDSERRQASGERALARAQEQFSEAAFAPRLAALYAEAIEARKLAMRSPISAPASS